MSGGQRERSESARAWLVCALAVAVAQGCAHGDGASPHARRREPVERAVEVSGRSSPAGSETDVHAAACFAEGAQLDPRAPRPSPVEASLAVTLPCEATADSTGYRCRLAEARALFDARRYEQAGPLLLDLAGRAPQGEAAAIALMGLESAAILGSFATPPRTPCFDLVARELPRLTSKHCGAEKDAGSERACAMLRRMELDLSRPTGCAAPVEVRPGRGGDRLLAPRVR